MCYTMTDTEMMDLVVIGKQKQPRAFRKANTNHLKILYFSNYSERQNRSILDDFWLRYIVAKMHGSECISCLTTRRVIISSLDATIFSWNCCRQHDIPFETAQHRKFGMDGLLTRHFSRNFLIGMFRSFLKRSSKRSSFDSSWLHTH